MDRRGFLKAAAGAAALPSGIAGLSAPALSQGAAARTLRFVPQADLALLDPIHSVAFVTRNHSLMVYDTLYGIDADFKPQPQMAEGHAVEDGGRRVAITLRPGLKFHDGEPVRAKDAVASIRRWARRDAMGQALVAATDELSAEDDRKVVFRLKRPFPLLFDALAKPSSPCCFIMPERIASADANTPIRDVVGSGPFRWVANEVDVVEPDEPLPNLPVARAVWQPRPDFETATEGWLTAGGPPERASLAAPALERVP